MKRTSQITISIPRDLHQALKCTEFNKSRVCTEALWRATKKWLDPEEVIGELEEQIRILSSIPTSPSKKDSES